MQKIRLLMPRRNHFSLFAAMLMLFSIFTVILPSSVSFVAPEHPEPLQPDIFDEYFTYVSVIPSDTDNDGLNDMARINYDVDTEGAAEEVKVIMNVYNSSSVIIKTFTDMFRVVHEIELSTRSFEYYAKYTDSYNFSLELYDLTHGTKENYGNNHDTSSYLLTVNTSVYKIFVETYPLDEDSNGYYDDVLIRVTDTLNYSILGVEIYVDGYYSGLTNARGVYYYYNLSRGIHEIDALYGGYHDNEEFQSEGIGMEQPLYADADPFDQDQDGYADDVKIYALGPNYVPVPGALVYIDWSLRGVTNSDGRFTAFDFPLGFHYVMITFQDYTAYSSFYAEASNETDYNEYFFYIWGEVKDLDGQEVLNDVDIYIDVDVDEGGTSKVYVYATVYYQNRTIAAEGDVNYTTTGWEIEDQHIYIYNLSYDTYDVRYELYDDYGNLEDVSMQYDLVIMSSFGIVNVDRMVYNFQGSIMNDVIYYAHIKDFPFENLVIDIYHMNNNSFYGNMTTDEYGIAYLEDLPFGQYYWYANNSKNNNVEYGEFNIYTAPIVAQVQDWLTDEDYDGFFDEFVITAYDDSGNPALTVNYLIWDEDDNLFDSGTTVAGGQKVVADIPEGNYTFYIKYGSAPFIWLCNGSFYSYGTPSESIDALNLLATMQDYDGDGYYDDVEILATNYDSNPVNGIVVNFDGDPFNTDTTNFQGKAYGYDFEFGWHSAEALNPYAHQGVPAGARAQEWFFSDGFNYNEYFWYVYASSDDLDGDGEWNDLNITIYAAVAEETFSIVTAYSYIYYQDNGTLVANNSITFEVFTFVAYEIHLPIYNLTYNETYNATYLLYDSDNNLEDTWYQYDIQIIPIQPKINIELTINSYEIDNIANDIQFYAHVMDKPIRNVSVKIYNSSTETLIYDLETTPYGYLEIDDVSNGDYYFNTYDENSTFIEYGDFFIGTDIIIQEFLGDHDFDGFQDDFLYQTLQKITVGLSPANFDIEFYDWNDKLINASYDNYIDYIIENLTEGHYKFKAYNNSLQLSSGSFYVYGNGFENQPPTPVISSPVDQSKYKPSDLIKFDGTQSSDPDQYDQISYYWESDKDGMLDESDKFWKKLSEGSHKITLFTDDAHGHNPSTFVTVSVQQPIAPNNPPVPVISSPTEGQQNYTGQSILFDGSQTTDPESDTLTYYWTSDISGPIKGNISKFTATLPLGDHKITMYVQDNHTNNVSAVVNISIIALPDNDVPIVNISLPLNNSIWNATDLIIFDSNGTYDPDDDTNGNGTIDSDENDLLSYSWVSSISGEISTLPLFNTTSPSLLLESGVHWINLTVVDPQGANATASVKITIVNKPPEASITQPAEGALFSKADEIGFFSSSSDPEDDVLYYWWEVQDKSVPTNVIKIHNQSHFTQKLIAGDYTVTFYADDKHGTDEFDREHNVSAMVNISVENRAPVAFAGADMTVNLGVEVEFNASGSWDPDGEDDEANFTYTWDFDDGVILQGMVVQHTFTSIEMYNVSLTVVDTGSATNNTDTDNLTIFVNTPPEAEIWAPSVVTKDALGEAKVYFDATNSTDVDLDILSYIWDFGDGTTGIGETATHTYTVAQVYTVEVNVSDDVGYDIATTTVRVNTAPVAETSVESMVVNVGEEIEFDGSASYDLDEDNLTYSWDFGDESTGIEVDPTHKYTVSAAYTVILNVSDDYGAWSNDTIQISVLPTAPAFTSHSEDEKVTGKITIEGRTYPSAGTVEEVQIKIGSGSWKDTEPKDDDDWSTWSYEWLTTDNSNGNYKILARLTNDQGTSPEASLNLTVNNLINYPTISITSPNNGADVEGDVTIRGSTTGESITSVRVRIGSGAGKTFKPAQDNSAGNDWSIWEFSWDTTREDNDDYTIYANVTATIQGKNYYDQITIDVTVNNPEVAEPEEEEDEEPGMLDSLLGNTMVIYGLVGLIILILIILIAVSRRKKKRPAPLRFEEEPGLEKVPPELELMEEKEEEKIEKPPEVRKIPVKCPKCKDIFISESDGTLPIILDCETCGARGIIRKLPEEEEKPEDEEKEEDKDSEDEKDKPDEEDEPVKRKPIIKCPNCDEIFPVDAENGEIECPNCGTKGSV